MERVVSLKRGGSAWYFFVPLALIAGAAAFIGAVHTKIYGHDIFFLLDNGWRVLQGQRPHVDYYSPFGPVTFLVAAMGLTLARGGVEGIGYANAVVSVGIGVWCFFLARGRLGFAARVVTSLFLAAMVASPYPLGLSPFNSSHAMVYNRYGYALLGLVMVEGWKRGGFWGGISTGIALALTLFLKATFFLAGMGIFAALALYGVRARRTAGVAAGLLVASFCLLAYLRFDWVAMLSDLRMAAGARSQSLHVSDVIWHALGHGSELLLVILTSLVAAFSLSVGWRLPVIGALLFGTDICLLSANAQGDSLPLIAIFGLLVANDLWAGPKKQWASLALCALLFDPQFTGDLTGLAYGALRKVRPAAAESAAHFAEPDLKALVLYDGEPPESNGRAYAQYVNDGAALLRMVSGPRDRVLTMDMTNPFPYALGQQPPRGGMAAVTHNITFSDGHRPSDEEYFGNADLVMVPKRPAQNAELFWAFFRLYEPGLKQRYRLETETGWWWLYRRK